MLRIWSLPTFFMGEGNPNTALHKYIISTGERGTVNSETLPCKLARQLLQPEFCSSNTDKFNIYTNNRQIMDSLVFYIY